MDTYNRSRYNKARLAVINLLGGKCVICEIDDIDVLQLDHIHDNGNLERRKTLQGMKTIRPTRVQYLLSHLNGELNLNDELQVLCANCNYKKELWRRELFALARRGIPPW